MSIILTSVSPDNLRNMAWLLDLLETWFDKWNRAFFLFKSLFEGVGLLQSIWDYFPDFLFPIVGCMLIIAIIMWVVNIF